MSNDLARIRALARDLRDIASDLLAQAEELERIIASVKRAAEPKLPVVEAPPGPTESYWLRGHGDGFAGMRPAPPNSNGMQDTRNQGYFNGYHVGAAKRRQTGAAS
jgi:hypothetical protein